MLHVHRSNRADALAAALADALNRSPLPDPMATEQVAVQSRGMERWLSHQLAERLGAGSGRDGICANVAFPFPGRVIHGILTAVIEDDADTDPWSPDRLVWPILDLLPTLTGELVFEPVRGYLHGGADVDRRTYGLARRVADLFDRYAMFRPDMVQRWSAGDDVLAGGDPLPDGQRWQPELWRQLDRRLGSPHLADRFASAVRALRDGDPPLDELPPRLTFFGTGALPPSYLEVIGALASHLDISLYVIAPSDVHWRRVADAAAAGVGVEERVEATHPLLISCGRLARDFQTILIRTAPEADGTDHFSDPADNGEPVGLLGRLQSDLLADLDRGAPIPAAQREDPAVVAARPTAVDLPDDRSVQLHACHGPARQVEVLHDALLHLFEDLPGLEPRDVLVMTPDIETYAPLVSAVFERPGTDGSNGPSIPFRLADLTLRRTNPLASALVAILEAADGRAEASTVLDLLGRPPVREQFGISEDAVGRIHAWVTDTGIRWGIDGDHRDQHGQPHDRHHTWERGLDRLLVGVAMADEGERLLEDVVPYDDMEGDSVEDLDRFVAFCDALFATFRDVREPRSISQWVEALNDAVDTLMKVQRRDQGYLDQLRRTLAGFVEASRDASTDEPSTRALTLDAIRSLLRDAGTDTAATAGYETGSVTFCAMIPMRSIPHRVICLLGMDDGAFPRSFRPAGFDLLARDRQLGDRDPRDEDRLLFLEAILAAQDQLVITYSGRDQRTNERKAPAVPVGELLDVLDRSMTAPDGQTTSGLLITEHPLQAFSPRNFTVPEGGSRKTPLSFDAGQLEAAKRVREGGGENWRFFPGRLPEPEGSSAVVELADLQRFLGHPIQWLFTNRLGMWLRERHEQVEDHEPIEADDLGRWDLGQKLLEARLDGIDEQTWAEAVLARGVAPVGTLGHYEVQTVRPVVDRILEHLAQDPVEVAEAVRGRPRLPIDVMVGEAELVGQIGDFEDGNLIRLQYSRLKAKHRLEMWLQHLALCAAYPDAGLKCIVAGRGDGPRDATAFTFQAMDRETALDHLETLIELHRRGACEPLPLFENASEAYVEAILKAEGKDASAEEARAAAEKAARKAGEPGYRGWDGDLADAHVAQCYGDGCEMDTILNETDFAEVAMAVWEPILKAEVEL